MFARVCALAPTRTSRTIRSGFVALLAAAALAGCASDPQAPSSQPAGYQGLFDASRNTMEFNLSTPSGGASALVLLATDIQLDEATQEVHAWVAVRNTGGEAQPGPATIRVEDFSPRDVEPLNAMCQEAPCIPEAGPCPRVCEFDHHDTYGGDGMLDGGEVSEAREWVFRNPSLGSFAFHARMGALDAPVEGLIAGVVFRDANANGVREDSEPGIPGVPVALRAEGAGHRVTTNDRGAYSFRVDAPGLYEIVWDSATDCEPTTPTALQVLIVRRSDGSLSNFTQGNFGCRGVPHVGVLVTGIVYHDANENGILDRGELGIPNILVTAAAPQCPTFAPIETRTGRDGRYRLLLPECTPPYEASVGPLAGWRPTTPTSLRFESPPAPGTSLRADFGLVSDGGPPGYSVEGFVFLDLNRNGLRENDEPGVVDVQMTASGLECLTPVLALTHTDARGHYLLRGADVHCPLPWAVQRHGPWESTTANPVFLSQPPPDGESTFHLDFGVASRDSVPDPGGLAIVGFVFDDRDEDGIYDFGEPGVANAEVQLLSPCEVLRLVRTDSTGRFQFTPDVVGVCPVTGVYQSAPEFAKRTTPNPFLFNETNPRIVRTVNFGVRVTNTP